MKFNPGDTVWVCRIGKYGDIEVCKTKVTKVEGHAYYLKGISGCVHAHRVFKTKKALIGSFFTNDLDK